ncbi:MAG: AsmA family protein, partial [Balneolaceae bacterium]
MKLFLKILAGIVIFFVVLLIGLNLYFTDDRLKNMILPEVREAVKTDVQVERMSLTFFRTFPRFGVELQQFLLPDPEGNTVASIEELLVSVELFPLFRNELSISRLDLLQPAITYRVFEDGTTNIDFLTGLAEEDDEPADDGLAIRIPRFSVTSGSLLYSDAQTDTELSLNGLDAQLSLLFSELIETSIDAQLESLSYSADGKPVVQNLSLGLRQTSVLNLDEETLTLTEGVLSIRGLALNLSGSLADWSSDAPSVDLQFTSSSDNFGELLRLAPSEFDEQLAGLDASGALTLDGFVNGRLGSEEIPEFSLVLQVTDGYLQNPDLPQPIEEIVIDLEINNQTAQLRTFRARAAQNRLSASGSLDRPLDEDGAFSLQAEGDVDLATVASFYPIGEMGVEQLSGKLELDLTANGRRDIPEEASFDGRFILDGGMLKYADVPRAIEDIQARVQANQNRITVESAGFRASNNEFTLSGSVDHPLDEAQRRLDLQAGIQFDLATIKEFYPIDEDTLTLRGQLTADLTLNGQLDPERPELLLSRSSMELSNGYIAHRLLGRALEEVTFRAEANREVLTLQTARFVSGPNSVAVRGSVTDYLTDVPIFDVTVEGDAEFGDIATYYSLEPWLNELSGSATMNLNAKGPAGDPTALALNGRLSVVNVAASGDSLPFPVSNANGVLRLTPDSMNLEEFTMNYGSSDFSLEGRVQNYLGFLAEEHNSEATMPAISGTYHSRFLNMDELIDWEEERDPTEPIPIGLPRLTSTVTASIDSMVVLGVPITNIEGAGRTTPTVIILDNARGTMFEGIMEGKMEWQVPDPNRTT